jgi:hypothetical protein
MEAEAEADISERIEERIALEHGDLWKVGRMLRQIFWFSKDHYTQQPGKAMF